MIIVIHLHHPPHPPREGGNHGSYHRASPVIISALKPVPLQEELSKRLDKEADQLAVGLSARRYNGYMQQFGTKKIKKTTTA